ncbi:MAG: glycosyltransferase [Lachnospiraceae bacterium]|nr:glycosyltransferase [Lachnospiraceae bacterium]
MTVKRKVLVSIIVPVYNIAPYIGECIESIQRQTYVDIEIIIVDDGSTDGSGELCKRFAAADNRIRLIHQRNQGVVTARGRGVEEASGEYISFIDGDDWIEPDMIEELVNEIGEADLITSGIFRQFTPKWIGPSYDGFPEGCYTGEAEISAILERMIYDADTKKLQSFTPSGFNKLYRSDLLKPIYRQIPTDIAFAEDFAFVYKYLLNCRSVVILHKCFYHYRYREESAVHGVNSHMLIDINKVYLFLQKEFQNHKLGEQLLYQLQKWVSFSCCKALNEHMGFNSRIHIPEFIADLSGLENKRLIVYGAGGAGKDTYTQLKSFGYTVVLWVDRDYRLYQSKGLPVVSPEEIPNQEYDLIFVAVGDQLIAEEIRKDLLKAGVPKTKLLWKKPIGIYI